jgi:hypothetical protein
MPDTPLGITYPASTDHTRLWEHFQALAEDVDGLFTVRLPKIQRCTTQTLNSSNSVLADVTGMPGWTLEAGKVYAFRFKINWESAVATTGIQFRVDYSGSFSDSWILGWVNNGSSTQFTRVSAVVNVTGGSFATTDSAGSADLNAEVEGHIVTTGAGTLKLRFQSEVNGSNAIVNVGTFAVLEEVVSS